VTPGAGRFTSFAEAAARRRKTAAMQDSFIPTIADIV
jgi:hypothetical protein